MSKTDESRIVLINGSGSEWYEQAIFILKSPNASKPKNLVFEAERIINDYMRTSESGCRHERLEQYKKRLSERSAQPAQAAPSTAQAAAETTARQTKKRKIDYTSFFINICLVLASVLLGYIMCRVMLQ